MATRETRPAGGWTELIDDVLSGQWVNPETGLTARVPYEAIAIAESLDGAEADLVAKLGLGESFIVVSDRDTRDAMGGRVAKALKALGPVREVVLDAPHADLKTAEAIRPDLQGGAVIAVGSGTVNDLCKWVTGAEGRRYAVFGTAASMNGYTSTTASMTLDSGLKVSLPSHAPSGTFLDLSVAAAAPKHLSAAGFGDCLVRSVAQVDWWMSHRLLGSLYTEVPFLLQDKDERELNARAADLAQGSVAANGYLQRVLTLCGLGVSFTGMSNHGSMGEHQISHYIDCFAGPRHKGTLHGQQVGVGVLTMARLQRHYIDRATAPVLKSTVIAGMEARMGAEIAAQCRAEIAPKVFDAEATARLNARLAEIWPDLRRELDAFTLPVAEMEAMLRAAGGPLTGADLGLPPDFYREAVIHCREMRNRYSFLDIAADEGILADFAAGEC